MTKMYLNFQSIKTVAIAAFTGTLLNVQLKIFPAFDLLIIMVIAIVIDFATGVLKSVLKKTNRTSQGYRRTVIKFTQYGGSILVGIMFKYMAQKQTDFAAIMPYVDYLTNGLVILIILIEVTSILENLSEMDNSTIFSKYVVNPLLRLLTFQIKNNPVNKAEDQKNE